VFPLETKLFSLFKATLVDICFEKFYNLRSNVVGQKNKVFLVGSNIMSHQNNVTNAGNNIFSYIEAKLNNIGNQICFVRKQIKWLKSHFARVISFLNFYERQYHVIWRADLKLYMNTCINGIDILFKALREG
jgi:hypothetical protein